MKERMLEALVVELSPVREANAAAESPRKKMLGADVEEPEKLTA